MQRKTMIGETDFRLIYHSAKILHMPKDLNSFKNVYS